MDFVVYGNAFNGNPEAGAVQVSENGTTWYELAGSKYYDGGFSFDGNKATGGKYSNVYTGTLRDTTVNYTKGSDIQVTLGGNGPKTFTTSYGLVADRGRICRLCDRGCASGRQCDRFPHRQPIDLWRRDCSSGF